MKEIFFEESKEIMAKTLESVDRCCRENNLKYSLCWGTLIGAIRHKGFIPWDDDIDIMMPREDYNRFLKIYSDPVFAVNNPQKDKERVNIILKVYNKKTTIFRNNKYKNYGVWVSIFPYDKAPDENLEKWEKKRDFWMRIYHLKAQNIAAQPIIKQIVKRLIRIILLPFSSLWLYNKVVNCLAEFNDKQTKRICVWYGTPYMKFRIFPKELFDEFLDVDFEHMKAKVIKGYDEFLRITYGDYMKFPPESERIPKHDYHAYWID